MESEKVVGRAEHAIQGKLLCRARLLVSKCAGRHHRGQRYNLQSSHTNMVGDSTRRGSSGDSDRWLASSPPAVVPYPPPGTPFHHRTVSRTVFGHADLILPVRAKRGIRFASAWDACGRAGDFPQPRKLVMQGLPKPPRLDRLGYLAGQESVSCGCDRLENYLLPGIPCAVSKKPLADCTDEPITNVLHCS